MGKKKDKKRKSLHRYGEREQSLIVLNDFSEEIYQFLDLMRMRAKRNAGTVTAKQWDIFEAKNDNFWFQSKKRKKKHLNPYYNWPDNRTKAEIDKAIEDSYTFF